MSLLRNWEGWIALFSSLNPEHLKDPSLFSLFCHEVHTEIKLFWASLFASFLIWLSCGESEVISMHYLKQAGVLCVFEWQQFFSTKDNFMTSCIYFVMFWHCVLIDSCSLMHSAEVHASSIIPLIFFSGQSAFEYWKMFVWNIAICKHVGASEELCSAQVMVQGPGLSGAKDSL